MSPLSSREIHYFSAGRVLRSLIKIQKLKHCIFGEINLKVLSKNETAQFTLNISRHHDLAASTAAADTHLAALAVLVERESRGQHLHVESVHHPLGHHNDHQLRLVARHARIPVSSQLWTRWAAAEFEGLKFFFEIFKKTTIY